MGSISVTHTCADSARSACADPLPTSPYPATTAAVQIVEFRLGHRVVDVEGRKRELAALGHVVQPFDAGGGFLRNPLDLGQPGRIPLRIDLELRLDRREQMLLFLAAWL